MVSRLGLLERAKEKIRSELSAERETQSHSELAKKIRKFLGLR